MLERRLAVVLVVVLAVGGLPSPALAGTPAQEGCSFPYSTVDATGTGVTIDAEPERVVTLAPSAAQTLWAIGARERVVGLSTYGTYLEGAGNRTVVSDAQGTVVIEEVVALSPDLVLAPNVVPNETVSRLRDAGLVVVRFGPARTIEDVVAKTERIGRLVGACAGADRTVAWMRDRLEPVHEATRDADRPGALYVFFGFTASSGTFVHEMIETAGGENVAAAAGVPPGYHRFSQEVVANRSDEIDWIVLNSDDPSPPRTTAYNETRALREGNVVVLDANLVSQPGPRIVYPITRLVEAFHPEAYAAANASSTPTESPTPATTATPSPTASSTPSPGDTPTPTTATPGQSGFAPLLVLLALSTTIAAARARS